MCRYVVYLSDSLRYTTIDNYVSGVISLNKYFGLDTSHIRQDYAFIATMAGLRRILGDPAPVRVTLSLGNILTMYYSVDLLNCNQRAIWTCIVTSFRSLLRKSNLVPESAQKLQGHYLRREAVSFESWGVMLSVSSSKTIQYGQRTHQVPLVYAPGSPLCAASLLWRHFSEHPAPSSSPAFLLKRGDISVPLTYGVLLKELKRLIRGVGVDPHRAGVHSLRRAGAAFMHQVGIPLEDIRQTGDWASLAALLYLAKPISARIALDRRSAQALFSAGF